MTPTLYACDRCAHGSRDQDVQMCTHPKLRVILRRAAHPCFAVRGAHGLCGPSGHWHDYQAAPVTASA